jgi:predicted component of type VI protein secretion system
MYITNVSVNGNWRGIKKFVNLADVKRYLKIRIPEYQNVSSHGFITLRSGDSHQPNNF